MIRQKSRWRMGWRIPNPNRTAGEQYQGNRWSRESDRHRYMDQKVHHSHRSLGRSGSGSGDGGEKEVPLSSSSSSSSTSEGQPKKTKKGEPTRLDRGVGGRGERRFAKGTSNIRLIEEPLLRLLRDSDVSREKMKFGISSSSFFSDCLCLSS